MKLRLGLAATAMLFAPGMAWAASDSAYASIPMDARAVTVQAKGDGKADDSAAIQQAIDAAADKGGGGIVFLPSGRYRITRTLYLWPGVRLLGAGATRPVLLLADHTPGYQQGLGAMLIFAGARPDPKVKVPVPPQGPVPATDAIPDANSGTFYTALANIDFEIGAGNPAAVGVRQHAAQHSFLRHVDFRLGSALAGVYQVGNIGVDLHFHGGRYGILTEKPSPAWQYTLLDSSFDGQRDAAIREHEANLTLVNTRIADTPVGIEIDKGYSDRLWGSDIRFERVSRAGVIVGNEGNAYTQIAFEKTLARDTPVFAYFRDSGRDLPGKGATYRVDSFTYGLTLPGLGAMGKFDTRMEAHALASLPEPRARAIRALPPTGDWVNVRTLGVAGDGTTDDSAAIQRAIDAHRVLYFPAGHYRVRDTLRLRPDSVLIGLHPSLTQIVLAENAPGFAGVGNARGLIESARGGDAIVSGLGLFTGGVNPRASAILWRAGEASLIDDVKIEGGHGTDLADGSRFDPYNPNHTADPDPDKRWDGQYPSIWVRDGGGGTFASLWTPNTYAQSGLTVTDTATPGYVYELSAEHHRRAEIVLDHVANWEFFAPQTEEEVGESKDAVSLEIRNSHDLLFANYHGYRVTRSIKPARAAVTLSNSGNIRFRNVHVNGESGYGFCDANGCGTFLRASKFPFENAIHDLTGGAEVREREFAVLDVPATPAPASGQPGPAVEKLADGFYAISGGAVDGRGRLYFVDHHFHRIWRWSAARGLEVVRDAPLDPVNLAVDGSGRLLVLSSAGDGTGVGASVYSFDPDTPDGPITVIAPTPVRPRPDARIALPVNRWNNGEFRDQLDLTSYRFPTLAEMFARDAAKPQPREYVSPDGSLTLPAFRVIEQGPSNHMGWRWSESLQAYGFVAARPGARVYVTNESEDRTYSGLLGQGGSLTDLKLVASRGGESVAAGPDGNVYVANGQVFVYAPDGRELERIDVPERPLQLLFGGSDGRTLYVLAHHGLYAVKLSAR